MFSITIVSIVFLHVVSYNLVLVPGVSMCSVGFFSVAIVTFGVLVFVVLCLLFGTESKAKLVKHLDKNLELISPASEAAIKAESLSL